MSADQATTAILELYEPTVVARGRDYAKTGRVRDLEIRSDVAYAVVEGTAAYKVSLVLDPDDPVGNCTCPAWARQGECKHVAALAWALKRPRESGQKQAAFLRPPAAPAGELPAVFHRVFSCSHFLERLSLYEGRSLTADVIRWESLRDWWRQGPRSSARKSTRDVVIHRAPEIEAAIATLRTWEPPRTPLPETMYGVLYQQLTELYAARLDEIVVHHDLPGPLDARHPGFDLSYEPKRRVLMLRERLSPLLPSPRTLAVELPVGAGAPLEFLGTANFIADACDAWELFALRELLLMLDRRTDIATEALERELGRPVWDHLLEHLAAVPQAAEAREWTFVLVSTFRDEFRLAAFARSTRNGRTTKWKKEKFDSLFSEECMPIERDIARVALCTVRERNEARMELGTPQGHELARLLARHPRVLITGEFRPDPEKDVRADLVVGEVMLRLESVEGGALVPQFRVADRPVPIEILSGTSVFRGGRRGTEGGDIVVYSVEIPRALDRWINAAQKMAGAMSFPREAVARLATVAEPLLMEGTIELPRVALGEELPYEPVVGLRIEWQHDGTAAKVEAMIAPRAGAPLVAPGAGARLFTYETDGKRVFVERKLDVEEELAATALERVEAPVGWDGPFSGSTDGLEETLALADYLERNPAGLPIEIKIGRRPTVIVWSSHGTRLDVRKKGSWLVLDGTLEVEGVKLTIGEVLEAARLARRYVKAANGVFLQLSAEAIAKLQPVAIAAELAPSSLDVRVHDAFGTVVADVASLFEHVGSTVALHEYARRFEKREQRVRVAGLENGELRPYQRDGVEWVLRLATWAPGCLLADDMGLGKTIQTAAVLKARAKQGPALIVAPASVTSNWIAELARFMPSLRVHWYNEQRHTDLAAVGPGDVVIVSYGLLQRLSAEFASRTWTTLVIDEAQYVKNTGAQRTDAIRSLPREFTIALTGTPLENHLGELFSIVDVVFPGLLGDEGNFRERFRRPIEIQKDAARLAALSRLLAPFLLRRSRAEVLEELPSREDIVEYIELGPEERRRYLALRQACEDQFAKRRGNETAAQTKIALLAALTRLRQLACDVRLVDPSFEGGSTKIARAVELGQLLAAEGNRALVFSQFTQFLTKVRVALEAAGLRVAYLAGDTPTLARKQIVDAFQAGDYDIFCVSLLAGGTGLNLTRASYVIHLDPWWNPAAEEQATSRAHRMGQTSPVTVYRLVARGTIEEAVLDMHGTKRELAAAVLDGKGSAKAISSSELLDLLRFGA